MSRFLHLLVHYLDVARHEAVSTTAWEAVKTNIGANLWWIPVAVVVGTLIWPRTRHAIEAWFHRVFSQHPVHGEIEHLHAKIDAALDHLGIPVPLHPRENAMPPPKEFLPRRAGKLGRKRAVFPPELRALNAYRLGGLAPATPSGDVTGGAKPQMFGNDLHSDCAAPATFNIRLFKAASAGTIENFTDDQVLSLYSEYCGIYNGGQDDGVVLSTWLHFLYGKGLCLGYGLIEEAEALAYAAAGHGVIYGVDLTDQDQDDFSKIPHVEWGTNSVQPDPNLGHAIALCKWDPRSRTFATWGDFQQANLAWVNGCTEERWVIITHEDSGIDLAALRADIDTIPGGIVAPPPPVPPPVDPPVAPPAPAPVSALIIALEKFLEELRRLV